MLMARVKYKERCKICKEAWTLAVPRRYTVCKACQMKQIYAEEITSKKYSFLNIPRELYEQSYFLRDIRRSYLFYKELSAAQIDAFKKAVKEIKKES
jgi:hypothetical protein